MDMRERSTAAAAGVLALMILTSCSSGTVVRLPDEPTAAAPSTTPAATETAADPASADDDAIDCVEAPVTIAEDRMTVSVTGVCPSVTITGHDTRVDLENAAVGDLVIEGDRNRIAAAAVETLEIAGYDNVAAVETLDAVRVAGDRNEVTATSAISSVVVAGADNTIVGRSGENAVDEGERNELG